MAGHLNKPKKLKKGDRIAFVAPSSFCAHRFERAKEQLEKSGFEIFVHPQCLSRDFSSAGTTEEKAAALHDVFSDPAIDAVFALRGGYRALHTLDKLDYDIITQNPKILLGYSNVTALHGAFLARSNLVTFHGPLGCGFDDLAADAPPVKHDTAVKALEFLMGDVPQNLFHDVPVPALHPGEATGILWGGNMQMISALLEAGGNYCPTFDNAILVIEEIDEEISKIDRQLGAWRLRGILKNLAGLVIGGMTGIKDTPGDDGAGPFAYTVEEIVRQHCEGLDLPIVIDAPFGHVRPNYVFPQGVKAKLTATGKSSLTLLESPFADA